MRKRRADYVWNVWVKSFGIPVAIVSTATQALASDFSIGNLLSIRVLVHLLSSVVSAIPISYLVGRVMWHFGFGQEEL